MQIEIKILDSFAFSLYLKFQVFLPLREYKEICIKISYIVSQ
jgi:hypothetical protein